MTLEEVVAARRRHLGGWPDTALFVGAAVAGGLGMYVLKSQHAPQRLVTGFVVATMLVYALVVFLVPRMRLRSDQAGDNAYYLGLLFTLTSMAFALHEFGLAQGAALGQGLRLHVSRIIGDFGVALASTIAGIFLRILLHQMRVDPEDIEEAARLELVGAAVRVREQVRQVVEALGEYHQQVSQRRHDEIAELVGAFRQIGEAAEAEVGHATRSIEAAVQTAGSRLDAMLGELQSGLRASAEALAESTERIQGVKLPTAAVSNRLERIAGSLEGIAQRLEAVGGALSHIQSQYLESEGAARAEIENAIASAQLLTNTAKMVQEGLAEAFGELSEAVAHSTRAIAENAYALASLKAESRTAVQAVEEAQAAATAVLSALAEHSASLAQAIRAAAEGGERHLDGQEPSSGST